MSDLAVDDVVFRFPDGWRAQKYDDWQFYREKFAKQFDEIQAVDCIALSVHAEVFLIEVKNYCHPGAIVPADLAQSIANKVLCTLAALLPARLNATVPEEQDLAEAILQCRSIKVVLHIELPEVPANPRKKNFRSVVAEMADLKDKLKSLLRAVDVSPKVVSIAYPRNTAWTVTKSAGNAI